jgi:hypothetical protein
MEGGTKMEVPKKLSLKDLNLRAASDVPFRLQLKDTEGKALPVFLLVLGDNSDKVQSVVRNEMNRRRQQSAVASKRGREEEVTLVEDDEELALDSLVARTVGWEGIDEPFSAEHCRELYRNNSEVRKQVLAASQNAANFTKK